MARRVRILVLTFYFRPDLSAGSFRASALVESLLPRLSDADHIDVLTTRPNRYASYPADAPACEEGKILTVRRFDIGRHRGGMLDQSIAFRRFARQVRHAAAGRRYDLVFATSSRLMTAVLGASVAHRSRARLYLDIRDIFADSLPNVVPSVVAPIVSSLFGRLERRAIARADRVNLVSAGFLEYFTDRYPGRSFSTITNGIDTAFTEVPVAPRPSPRLAGPGTTTLLYAGNIGEGQGLHRIIPELAQALGATARIRIIGDGARRAALDLALSRAGVTNVVLEAPLERTKLAQAYRDADVLVLHLNDFAAFRRVLPSKLFEYAAMGKPILAGVSGYTAAFLAEQVDNAAVFAPGDVAGAVQALGGLRLEDAPRAAFVERYSRRVVSDQLADDVLTLAERRDG